MDKVKSAMAAIRQATAAASTERGPSKGESPASKKSRKGDEDMDDVDIAQMGAKKFASMLKKELGDMIDEKVGNQVKVVDAKVDAIAKVTDEGFAAVAEEIEQERKERKEWQSTIDTEMVKGSELMEVESQLQKSQGLLAEKVKCIEEDIAKMKIGKGTVASSIVAVVGGLGELGSLEEADQWMKAQLVSIKAPLYLDMFIKGDTFKGVVFGKFSGPEAANAAITRLTRRGCNAKAKAFGQERINPSRFVLPSASCSR